MDSGTEEVWKRVAAAAAAIERAGGRIQVAVVLGSGLGAFAERLEKPVAVSYAEVPGFPVSRVAGHAGRYLAGRLGGRALGVFQGRFHHYEGWSAEEVALPVRVAHALGARTAVLTNAAGSTRPENPPGRLMLIRDHLNLMGANPLRGPNDDRRGPRFPALNEAYSPRLAEVARRAAAKLGVALAEGVYLATAGPSYETPAEVAMMRGLGADAIGMSTVPETIAARHLGLEVLGISCLTNYASGVGERAPDHEEVLETGRRAARDFVRLLEAVIEGLPA